MDILKFKRDQYDANNNIIPFFVNNFAPMLTLHTGDLGGSTGIPRSDRKSELWSTSNHSEAASEQPSIHETYLASDKNQNLTPSTTEFKANPALSSGGREVQMLPGSQQVSPLQDFVHTAVGGNPSSGGNLQGQQIGSGIYIFSLNPSSLGVREYSNEQK